MNDRNIIHSARSAIIFAFSILFFEICYYFRYRFVLQHSSNACTIIQLAQILGEIHIFLETIPGFFLDAPRIPGKIQVNTWNKKHWRDPRFHCGQFFPESSLVHVAVLIVPQALLRLGDLAAKIPQDAGGVSVGFE